MARSMSEIVEQMARAMATADGFDPDELNVHGTLPIWQAYFKDRCQKIYLTRIATDVMDKLIAEEELR